MWIEICSDNSDDWKEAIRIGGDAFAHTPWLSASSSSQNSTFSRKYFEYIYETELSDDRAELACVKTKRSDGSVATAYVSVLACNRLSPTAAGDTSAMRRECPKLTDDNLAGDTWIETTVHRKIQAAAECLGFCYIYGVFDAIAPEFAGFGIGRKYFVRCVDTLYWDAIRRGKLTRSKPCVIYGLIDDPLQAKSLRGNVSVIAHLHVDDRTLCLLSETSSTTELCNGCHLVTATVRSTDDKSVDMELLRKLSLVFEKNLVELP